MYQPQVVNSQKQVTASYDRKSPIFILVASCKKFVLICCTFRKGTHFS